MKANPNQHSATKLGRPISGSVRSRYRDGRPVERGDCAFGRTVDGTAVAGFVTAIGRTGLLTINILPGIKIRAYGENCMRVEDVIKHVRGS
ncbi:MAG TPA: hypothetical protein VNO50_10875 [Pyrinomonadaceae bacterium]|nr:hypothetical protein [Pyrinomonadaceae bacterium]